MNRENFEILIGVLKKLQKMDCNGSRIEDAIVEILDSIENNLDNEQKQNLIKEFINYQRLRQEKNQESKKKREEALYRDQINSYLFDSH